MQTLPVSIVFIMCEYLNLRGFLQARRTCKYLRNTIDKYNPLPSQFTTELLWFKRIRKCLPLSYSLNIINDRAAAVMMDCGNLLMSTIKQELNSTNSLKSQQNASCIIIQV